MNKKGRLIVDAIKVKECEKCGGHWAWRQANSGTWYPANATDDGYHPVATLYTLTHQHKYLIDILGHSKFCKVGA